MPIWLIQILVGIVLSVAGQIISSIGKQDQKQKVSGVRGTLQTGGDHSPSFIIGRYGTAGKLKYAGTWGNAGETPNAYYSKVIEVSYLPIRGFSGFFVNGERVTLDASKTGDLGYAVLEYRVGGVDHLWINPYLGDQTAADPLMRNQFGSDPDRPYTAEMIGLGLGYFVATALVNRELFSGFPEYLAEVDGIALDDPRGDDAHDNPIVAAYTLLKGLSYGGAWVYGPQTYTDNNFRLSNIETEADKCDVAIALAGGGTMPRFRMGLEVSLDAEPHAIVGELLKSCQGRWADVGGVFKFLVGEPGAPVVGITDEDMVITEQQTFEPFPGLESLFNGIAATYPEPAEAWETKEAPPRYRSDLEVADGRRLPFSTDFKAVPYAVQVQELMRAAIEETRRFRRHTQTMLPEWWEYEVLDVAAWTSDRNGYEAKQFLITAMEDLPNANQFVGLQEIEPADYGWDSDYELPWDVAPLVIARPAPQVMTGWNVAPFVVVDADGASRRPAIEVFWASGLVDVRAVEVQVRETWGSENIIFDGELPYDPAVASPSAVPSISTLLPNTTYEVRGKYLPFSGRVTLWSNQSLDGSGNIVEGDWLGVTTPNVKLGASDIAIDLANVAQDVLAQLGLKPRQLIEQFKQIGTLLEEVDRENYTKREALFREITVELEGLEASFTEIIEVALGPGGAIALALESLYAAMGGNTAEVNVRWEAVAAPSGYSARYAIQAAVNDGTFRAATLFLDVPADPTDPTRIGLMAGQTAFFTSAGVPIGLMDENGFFRSANDAVVINMLNGDFSFG
ncbi:MAG TPA: hypothetical protein VGN60_07510 [Devosia sp.]|jgi:hypothetical protein|nr:hypothetical protein [Devosia sp.]